MHQEHSIFSPPTHSDIAVWRYMDLPKLVAMLCDQALWFGRADTLGDSHEGAYGQYNVALRSSIYSDIPLDGLTQISEASRKMVKHVFVNCWHMAEEESVAMWRVYAPAGRGVAVRSTYRRLTSSLTCSEDIYVGTVRYVDPANEWINEGNLFWPFLHKRLSFGYERELRAVRSTFPGDGIGLDSETPLGFSVKADLAQLIDAIYVAPGEPDWYRTVVENVVRGFGPPGIVVRPSSLDTDPLF